MSNSEIKIYKSEEESPAEIPPSEQYSIQKICQKWLEEKRNSIKESTYQKYYKIIHIYLLPYMGQLSLADITEEKIKEFCDELKCHGGKNHSGLADKTIFDYITVLKSILQFGVRRSQLKNTAFLQFSYKVKHKPLKVITLSEQRILQEYIQKSNDFRDLGILLCLYSGLRIGELCALKWDDISLIEGSIHVTKTMQRINCMGKNQKTEIIITSPKTDYSIRYIPLPDVILAYIKEYYIEGCYILSGDSDTYVEPRNMQHHFHKVLKKCNLSSYCFHTLRHTFATRCMEAGFDVKSLSEILGHSSVNITLNRYVHPSFRHKKEKMNLLSELL